MSAGTGWPVGGPGDRSDRAHTVWRVLFLALLLAALAGTAAAQDDAAVQELAGRIEPGQAIVYDLDLQAGRTLYAYAEGTSGDLDPFLAVASPDLNASRVHTGFATDVNRSLAAGQDPLLVIPEIAGRYFLAWNDDTNGTYDSALQYRVPADGDYLLIAIGSPAKREQTFGDYRLLVGIDAPQVLTGRAGPTGAAVAVLNTSASRMRVGVREVTGNLSANRSSTFYLCEARRRHAREGSLRKGEVNTAPLLHFHAARLFFMPKEDYYDSIVCCGGTSTGYTPRRIRRS